MSLTNPDAIVTEERLAEFYQTIFPYLGGMPDILANKFAKGDMYSTDEKMIGQWIDGKPLYQKTVTGTTNFDGTTAMASFDSTCYIVDMKAYIVSAEKSRQYNPFWYSVNNFWCMRIENNKLIGTGTTGYYNNKDFVATVYYTKTTDSAVYIGDDADYSTDEKIVGTWIDGKPLYQKTIDYGSLPNSTTKNVAHNISNLDKICNVSAIAMGNNVFQSLPQVNDAIPNKSISIWIDDTYIGMRASNADWSAFNGYITVQYTKTTD